MNNQHTKVPGPTEPAVRERGTGVGGDSGRRQRGRRKDTGGERGEEREEERKREKDKERRERRTKRQGGREKPH